MPAGRRPDPPHLKAITGSADPSRPLPVIEQNTYRTLPDPPDYFDSIALRYYTEVGQVLVANRLLTALSFAPFCHLCALHSKLVKVWTAQELPPGGVFAQYRQLICEFGMTPASAGRVSPMVPGAPLPNVPGAQAPTNRFGNNGRRA